MREVSAAAGFVLAFTFALLTVDIIALAIAVAGLSVACVALAMTSRQASALEALAQSQRENLSSLADQAGVAPETRQE